MDFDYECSCFFKSAKIKLALALLIGTYGDFLYIATKYLIVFLAEYGHSCANILEIKVSEWEF